MVEIEATVDPVRLSFLRAVLEAASIPAVVFEPNIGGLWPGAVASRLMVARAHAEEARRAIVAADPSEVWR